MTSDELRRRGWSPRPLWALTSVVVYALGSLGREGATPVKLALAGAAITAFLGSITTAILLLGSDVIGRVVARPGEVQVGIVTALIGAPFFIALVRRRKLAEL